MSTVQAALDREQNGVASENVAFDRLISRDGAITGTLVGFADDDAVPLVTWRGQSERAALRAMSIVDLNARHVGRDVVLMFDGGDPRRPIVMGCLRGSVEWARAEAPGRVEVDADGERLVVNAREQLVLRCGRASITLTRAGKVLIQGAFIMTRSSGVNRIKGGSVEIN